MIHDLQKMKKKGIHHGRTERRIPDGFILFTSALLVISLTMIPVLATEPTVIISKYEVTPAVLFPGDLGTVTLDLSSTAKAGSEQESSGLVTGGAFSRTKNTDINVYIEKIHVESKDVKFLTDRYDRLGELGPGQTIPVTFVIKAPDTNGIYFPEVWIDVAGGRSTRYPIIINVNTDISSQKKPALAVFQQVPDNVTPGENCMAEITVENTGLTRASDISVLVNSTTKSLIPSTQGRYYIEHLDPGEKTDLSLTFATDKQTPLGINPVQIGITYRTPDGRTEKQTEILGIPIKGKAEIAVSSLSTDPVRPGPGSVFTLVSRVENTGTDRAISVKSSLESPFSGTREAFIGSIDTDSDAPAIFYLQATREGIIPVNLTISYEDDYGSHTINESASVMVYGSSGMMLPVIVLILIISGAGAVFWYLRRRAGNGNA
ncbi:MAG: S-layer protein [Methanospirillum sp.]|nr:S-layer protein [Methanospirillum sp.]